MRDAELLLLHLSDIHIHTASDPVLARAKLIAQAVKADVLAATNILIAVTGDVAYSGKASQYELATTFLLELQEELRSRFGTSPHLIVVPGNHDCDFDHEAEPLRRRLIQQQKDDPEEVSPEVLAHCCKIMGAFDDFRGAVETLRPVEFSPVWRKYSLGVGSRSLTLHAVNNSWASEKRLEPGSLSFPTEQHLSLANEAGDLRIALLHHPAHWLNQSRYRDFRKLVRQSADLVLTGHEHEVNAGVVSDLEAGNTAFSEAGALQEHQGDQSAFSILRVSVENRAFCIDKYRFNGHLYVSDGPTPADISLAIPQKAGNGTRFTAAWQATLSDLGAAVRHHAKAKVDLLDLFVMPDLEAEEEIEETPVVVSSSVLLDPPADECKILVKGEQGAGKSSLLRACTLMLRDAGYIPVYVNGAELKSSSTKDLKKVLDAAITEQYGTSHLVEISQLDPSRRVLVLDNLDRYGFPDRYFNVAIATLVSSFGRVIASADKLFDFRAAVHGETFSALHSFIGYTLKPFGVRKRYELVRKWFQLERAETREDEERIRRNIGESEKVLSSVVGRGLVPSFPIYMLVLLQGIEAGRQGELENSALGTYYQYLLVHSLLEHVRQDQVQGVFNYCAHLAWYLKQTGRLSVGERELRSFHAAFERLFDLEIDFRDRVELLTKSKILLEAGGDFAFRYPYSYYFFLGSYLSAKLGKDQEADQVVRTAADALHVRENANILLFVAHHSQGSHVMNLIEKSLERLFADVQPITFASDIGDLNRAVDELPKLVFDEHRTEDRRVEVLEEDAQLASRIETAAEKQAAAPDDASLALRLASDLNGLFKGIEILGVALKSNAEGIQSEEKQRVINCLFEGGLRGLKAIFEKLTSAPDYLIGEIRDVLDRKKPGNLEEKQRVASQAVFFFLSSIAYLFIRRVGTAVGSKALRPALTRYVAANPTVAKRLVHLSCLLETPGPLPLPVVRELHSDLQSQAFPLSVLRQLALARVYLYYTEAAEKQQLCSDLEIEMRTQRAIDYQTKDAKKVKKPS